MPVDVSLAFGSAAVCYAVASAFCCLGRCFASLSVSVSGARVICCSPTPSCRACALCCAVQCSVFDSRSAGSRSQMLAVCFQPSLHTTPHPFITHHTTQYPHTSYTTNHAYQPSSLPPTTTHSCPHKFGMVYSLLYASDALSVLDQVYQIIQSCNILLKLNQVIQNPTHTNTPTKTRTKTRTNTRPTDTHLQLCLYIHTELHHKYTHKKNAHKYTYS